MNCLQHLVRVMQVSFFYEFNRVNDTGGLISSHHLPQEFYPKEYYKNLMRLSEEDMFGYTWIKAFRRNVLEKSSI